jgi:3D (Asp-Asp-Asp) domain-containing protein
MMSPTTRRVLLGVALVAVGAGCAHRSPAPARPATSTQWGDSQVLEFEATAYCITGTTASGMQTRPGIVAADPAVLPLGSRIRVSGAGTYSGVYTVADTGPAVRGRTIDIFMPEIDAAKTFGRRRVGVEILERGSGGK